MSSNVVPFERLILETRPQFERVAESHGAVRFLQECEHALALLAAKPRLAEAARKNPQSLKSAIVDVAQVGLTLAPAAKHAHLVPRDGRVCLDIGYQGLLHLGEDSGAIKTATPVLVHDGDTFKFMGVNRAPEHFFDPLAPLSDRGLFRGGYTLTITPAEDCLVDFMPLRDILWIRDRTESYRAWLRDKSIACAWESDFFEMCKKTLIRRAWKSWPRGKRPQRLDHAIEISNQMMASCLPPRTAGAPPGATPLKRFEHF
ncbi:MAG: hypothetical protein HC883_00460 [Bdellovibrionaceae bacterium]|nr:hypothetical protein [Pseudobdellovibrionaceae bacterium]